MPEWNEEDRITNVHAEIKGLRRDLSRVEDELQEFKKLCASTYLMKIEFTPVQLILYGLVSIMLLAVMGGVMTMVIRK